MHRNLLPQLFCDQVGECLNGGMEAILVSDLDENKDINAESFSPYLLYIWKLSSVLSSK